MTVAQEKHKKKSKFVLDTALNDAALPCWLLRGTSIARQVVGRKCGSPVNTSKTASPELDSLAHYLLIFPVPSLTYSLVTALDVSLLKFGENKLQNQDSSYIVISFLPSLLNDHGRRQIRQCGGEVW